MLSNEITVGRKKNNNIRYYRSCSCSIAQNPLNNSCVQWKIQYLVCLNLSIATLESSPVWLSNTKQSNRLFDKNLDGLCLAIGIYATFKYGITVQIHDIQFFTVVQYKQTQSHTIHQNIMCLFHRQFDTDHVQGLFRFLMQFFSYEIAHKYLLALYNEPNSWELEIFAHFSPLFFFFFFSSSSSLFKFFSSQKPLQWCGFNFKFT